MGDARRPEVGSRQGQRMAIARKRDLPALEGKYALRVAGTLGENGRSPATRDDASLGRENRNWLQTIEEASSSCRQENRCGMAKSDSEPVELRSDREVAMA